MTIKRTLAASLLLAGIAFGAEKAAAQEDRKPKTEVTGKIDTTRVQFKATAADKVTEAVVALLVSCHHKDAESEWDKALDPNKSFLHIRLPKPRPVATVTGEKLEATELLVLLPLNTGSIYVRRGDKASRFAKYDHQAAVRLQELLKEAQPAK
jgi:hypothetical protein